MGPFVKHRDLPIKQHAEVDFREGLQVLLPDAPPPDLREISVAHHDLLENKIPFFNRMVFHEEVVHQFIIRQALLHFCS